MPAKKSKSHKSKSSTKSSVPVASPPIPPRRSKSKGGSLSSGPKKDSHEHQGALHNHLTRRPSLKTVQNQTGGMCQQKICKSLHPRVQALNREISGNKINDFLIERPMPDELKGGILVGKVGDCRGVQNVAYKLVSVMPLRHFSVCIFNCVVSSFAPLFNPQHSITNTQTTK